MTTRAVLFDVGGPIDTEVLHEAFVDAYILRALPQLGIEVSEQEFAEASEAAVAAYAPDAYTAMIWRLTRGDPERAGEAQRLFGEEWAAERAGARGGLEVRPGIDGLIRSLHQRGLQLGLAANQPARIIDELDRSGLGKYFNHREVSGHHGFRKPDVRLFLRACDDLGVQPAECIMVGDRIDNDIAPANVLGMRTILFRTGRHIDQQPRSAAEVPDADVRTIPELQAALDRLITTSHDSPRIGR